VREKENKGGVDVFKLCCDWRHHKEPVGYDGNYEVIMIMKWLFRIYGSNILTIDFWVDQVLIDRYVSPLFSEEDSDINASLPNEKKIVLCYFWLNLFS
jgi:hypothetical protein